MNVGQPKPEPSVVSATIAPLLARADADGGISALLKGGDAFVSTGMRPYVLAALAAAEPERPVLLVAGDDAGARRLADDLRVWLDPRRVFLYPTRGIAGGSHLAPPSHLVGLRLAALDALARGPMGSEQAAVVVASAIALAERVPDSGLRPHGFEVTIGGRFGLEETLPRLVDCGYERVEQVVERGQFAIRGDIVDIFPATADHALRIDLWDEEIEAMRWFSTFTQRSLGEVESVAIDPAAELRLELREKAELAALVEQADRPPISELLPLDLYMTPLELADGALIAVAADEDVEAALDEWWADAEATLGDEADAVNVDPRQLLATLEKIATARISIHDSGQKISWRGGSPAATARSIKEAEPELERLLRDGYSTLVAFPRRGDAERAAHNLLRQSITPVADLDPESPGLAFSGDALWEGFIAPDLKLAAIPADRLVRRRQRQPKARHGHGILRSFSDLRTGDTVVHEDHGVARFKGFDTRTVAGVTRDYLELEYAGGDKVFMPVDQMAKITRHVGSEGDAPALSKLGGSAWERVKSKARAAADRLAGELLNLYAERRRRKGHAFPPDGEEQRRFEDSFPHRETRDQLDAIDAVKADMESAEPMDRLICGDVGYGKTEVALRAAFKCASEGKQVLVLVPTTILAQQHYGSFAERFEEHPLIVDHVSRFRSAAEQKQVVEAFNEGKVDVLVGTHRLLGRDIRPKDLGLLVVDEEQRFGVKQKELLRQLKLRTDVLAMSATPIPRTLQMSLAGIRDISVIETPPEGRRPVRTVVGEYDEDLVRIAIERELDRGGKVFFLHNRIESIETTAEVLGSLVPKARIATAHGALDESELEERMLTFVRGEADVLVCTSIIEAGLDIPDANTLIVDRADLFGLSQLYQIRGRVGRGTTRANAYLFYPSAAALTHDAAQRLAALSDHTELGSGFRIAMRDLEIRGAGNLLGPEQSGHVAALGFELYMKLLDEAVAAAEGDRGEAAPVRVEVNVDAWVPEEYVAFEKAKIEVHRRVASAFELAEVEDLRAELEDRFGPIPEPVERLLGLQKARIKLALAGASDVSYRQGTMTVGGLDLSKEAAADLRERLESAAWKSGAGTVSMPVEDEPQARWEGLVELADAIAAAAAGSASAPNE